MVSKKRMRQEIRGEMTAAGARADLSTNALGRTIAAIVRKALLLSASGNITLPAAFFSPRSSTFS